MAAAWSYGGQLLGVSALAIGDECAGARCPVIDGVGWIAGVCA